MDVRGLLSMNNKLVYINLTLILSLMVISSLLSFYGMSKAHEDVHTLINTNYGCQSKVSLFPTPHNKPNCSNSNMDSNDFREYQNMHILNEVVQYNLSGLLLIIIFFVSGIFGYCLIKLLGDLQ
jgi:hypothetical protein